MYVENPILPIPKICDFYECRKSNNAKVIRKNGWYICEKCGQCYGAIRVRLEGDLHSLNHERDARLLQDFGGCVELAEQLLTENKQLIALLKKYEWVSGDSDRVGESKHCLCCLYYEDHGHKPDCDIGNALEGEPATCQFCDNKITGYISKSNADPQGNVCQECLFMFEDGRQM